MSERVQELIELVKYHNDLYYAKDLPEISDDAYDELKSELEFLYKNLKLPKGLKTEVKELLDQVDAESDSKVWDKAKHNIFMGSQAKASNMDEFIVWWNGVGRLQILGELKFDGISLSLDYKDGVLIRATTRGKGGVQGEMILKNVLKMRNVKPKIDGLNGSFRAEILLTKENFKIVNQIRIDNGEEEFKNLRNGAGGIARNFDDKLNLCQYLHLEYYDNNGEYNTEQEKADYIKSHFKMAPYWIINTIEELEKHYQDFIDNKRDSLKFDIDGFVLKINDLNEQNKHGVVGNRPKGQIALKFPPQKKKTKIVSFIHATKRTGKISVKCEIEPVDIGGATIRFATLHNYDYILKELGGLNIGDEVMIARQGDIIPKVVEVVNRKGPSVEPPKSCPSCGQPTRIELPHVICDNPLCDAKKADRISHYVITLGLDGISSKFVDKLYESELINEVYDLYTVKREDIVNVDGLGESKADKFSAELQKCSNVKLPIFMKALGIDGLGESNSEKMISEIGFDDTVKFLKYELPDPLNTLKGIFTDDTAHKIYNQYTGLKNIILKLIDNVSFVQVDIKNILDGKSFCITGSLGLGRNEYKTLISENGGVFKSGVSKKLDYLIVGENSGGKLQKAHDCGVKVLNEDDFKRMIGEEE
jgi:DNA ligase (NAD+)